MNLLSKIASFFKWPATTSHETISDVTNGQYDNAERQLSTSDESKKVDRHQQPVIERIKLTYDEAETLYGCKVIPTEEKFILKGYRDAPEYDFHFVIDQAPARTRYNEPIRQTSFLAYPGLCEELELPELKETVWMFGDLKQEDDGYYYVIGNPLDHYTHLLGLSLIDPTECIRRRAEKFPNALEADLLYIKETPRGWMFIVSAEFITNAYDPRFDCDERKRLAHERPKLEEQAHLEAVLHRLVKFYDVWYDNLGGTSPRIDQNVKDFLARCDHINREAATWNPCLLGLARDLKMHGYED